MREKMRKCMSTLSSKGRNGFAQAKKNPPKRVLSERTDGNQRAYMPHQKT